MNKKLITTTTILLIGLTAFAQNFANADPFFIPTYSKDLRFEVRGKYIRPLKKEKIATAKLISDIIPNYPVNWMTSYTSVEVIATCRGITVKALSPNSVLSKEQKNILNTVDLATYVIVNIKYSYMDPVTKNFENNTTHYTMTVIPEIEAEYDGGKEKMEKYIKENIINKISNKNPSQFKPLVVQFVINENGEMTNVKVVKSSGDLKTDKLVLEVINKMPKWKPAENGKNIKVKQIFEFNIGNVGC